MDLNTIDAVLRPADRLDLSGWRLGDAFLAGGTWLFSEPQPHLSRLVDLAGLGWPPIAITPYGLHIAATCTLAHLAEVALPPEWIAAPLLGQCSEALLGSFKILNVATVGGNICLALPAGPMIAFATALEAECVVWTPDGCERRIAAADVVTGPQETALRPGEVLRMIEVRVEALKRRTAFRRASLTPLGRSTALLIGTVAADRAFTLTVTAATRAPVRLCFAALPEKEELAVRIAADIPEELYFDDVHGRPDWRRHMTFALAEEIRGELAAGERP